MIIKSKALNDDLMTKNNNYNIMMASDPYGTRSRDVNHSLSNHFCT